MPAVLCGKKDHSVSWLFFGNGVVVAPRVIKSLARENRLLVCRPSNIKFDSGSSGLAAAEPCHVWFVVGPNRSWWKRKAVRKGKQYLYTISLVALISSCVLGIPNKEGSYLYLHSLFCTSVSVLWLCTNIIFCSLYIPRTVAGNVLTAYITLGISMVVLIAS